MGSEYSFQSRPNRIYRGMELHKQCPESCERALWFLYALVPEPLGAGEFGRRSQRPIRNHTRRNTFYFIFRHNSCTAYALDLTNDHCVPTSDSPGRRKLQEVFAVARIVHTLRFHHAVRRLKWPTDPRRKRRRSQDPPYVPMPNLFKLVVYRS